MADNEYFIARREVMFQALKDYHSQTHEGQTEEQTRAALIENINKAASGNDRVDESQRAKIALEWEGMITSLPKEKLESFLKESKDLAAQPMPNLPKGIDYGADLSTLDVSNWGALMAVASKATAAGAKMKDLQAMVALNEKFETAAQKSGIIDYENGESLTSKLDEQSKPLTAEQIKAKQTTLLPLKPEEGEDKGKKKEEEEGRGNGILDFIGNLLSGIGNFFMMILEGIMSIFRGSDETPKEGDNKGADKQEGPQQEQVKQQSLAEFLAKSEGKFDLDSNGKFDFKDMKEILGESPDKDNDGKLSKEELAAINTRIDGAVEKNGQIADIASQFKASVQQLADSGGNSISLPAKQPDQSPSR